MRAMAIAGVCLALLSGPAFSQEMKWTREDNQVIFGDGPPDDILAKVSCRRDGKIGVWWHSEVVKVPGMKTSGDIRQKVEGYPVRLNVDRRVFNYQANLQPEEMRGGLEATFAGSRKLVEALMAGREAALVIGKEKGEAVPLKGFSRAIQPFLSSCTGR